MPTRALRSLVPTFMCSIPHTSISATIPASSPSFLLHFTSLPPSNDSHTTTTMINPHKSHIAKLKTFPIFLYGFLSLILYAHSQDAPAMLVLKNTLNPPESLGWSDPDPCHWKHIICSEEKRVTRIQIGHQGLQGTLPNTTTLQTLTQLERLELQFNNISGPLPSLNGLSSLQVLILSNNQFTSIPNDFFTGMSQLQSVELDNNPFEPWKIPDSIVECSTLRNFSANSANIVGKIPDFSSLPTLTHLHLAFNGLEGVLPLSFSGSQIETLWLNGQKGSSGDDNINKLGGNVDVLQNMTSLTQVWLHSNVFTGPLPSFSGLQSLQDLSLRDNYCTGTVPSSLVGLKSLKVVNLTNNLFQGAVPEFGDGVEVDLDLSDDSNSFCLQRKGDCDSTVKILLSVVQLMGYPKRFAENWKGNDPCAGWIGITCSGGDIIVVNFEKMGLNGTISSEFASLKSLQKLVLADNNLTGSIPEEFSSLRGLVELNVANNRLYGKIPRFKSNVIVNTDGNKDIGKDKASPVSPIGPLSPNSTVPNTREGNGGKKSSHVGVIVFGVIGGVVLVLVIGFLGFCLLRMKQKRLSKVQSPNALVIHPRHSGSDNESMKITVPGSSLSVGDVSVTQTVPSSEAGDIQMVEGGNMVISIQVLRTVTDNFSEKNILGQGGFGTVYKGELHDGTKIAVKRMESGAISGKGETEFKSEIAVLTKVRHRHLVSLIGYCLDGNEKLLVYEYMPQGTLSRHLFNWLEEGLKPLEWNRRLTIALDVARAVEYLHSLAHQSFIHRDLKPSNILLGDDMRAKVADFGLVRLAPEGKASIETRIAGTFGYLAPEYAVTGRVTTKVDVFSFGVILMELMTGRRALDDTQPEDSMHLVTWFRRMYVNKDSFRKAIDHTIELNEETLASIHTVAELATHCCAREPYQRPDAGHAVNVLSSLVEMWKPSDHSSEEMYGINLHMSLPQALKKWQAYEGRSEMESSSSSLLPSLDNTQTSIPIGPYGFAESFTSADGR